ncbi:MAG: oxidoreductase [Deltaproteobacteria bacterium]|nr:MAG: oxidoreductase [Deltaproteobacteria bacterium]
MSVMSASSEDVFVPRPARIIEATAFTGRERFYRLALDRPLGHRPGQFVMLSVLGIGEAPISISCGPREDNILEMVIREIGSLTQVVAKRVVGDVLGIRGPFGSGFDLNDFRGRDVLFVCGGLGLAPLRSLIQPVLAEREQYGKITIISGCRTPDAELYRDDLRAWSEIEGVEVIRLVDSTAHQPWDGRVGLVTAPIADLDIDPERLTAALCGPPVMYKFVVMALAARGVPADQIFVDLERRMRCGLGKCGHCQINDAYCCVEGPVFRLSDLERLPEAL